MSIYENIWVLVSVLLIVIILSTDPKSSTGNTGNNNIAQMFSSTTESRKFARTFSWLLIIAFYILTLITNYLN
jgi:protein translocase SecG subunit